MRRDPTDVTELKEADELPAAPSVVIEALDALLTEERRARIVQVISARTRDVIPVLDGLIDPHNIAAVVRSSDAFGIQEMHHLEGPESFVAANRVAKGTERWIDVVRHRSAHDCVRALHARGHRVYVAAMDGSITPAELARHERVAIVFGNEHAGVSAEMSALADGTYTIPMCGFVQSLNVSVAAAITLYAATQGRKGNLVEADRERLRARAVFQSVPRAAEVVAEYLRRKNA